MFHKVKEVHPLAGMRLAVVFTDGVAKIYDASALSLRIPAFRALEEEGLFESVAVDAGGYGIAWNDELDLSCDELWGEGTVVQTPFDGLMSLADATEEWGLSESALRKAIAYGKLASGMDARKYGKQWIVARDAMIREYGNPKAS